MSKLLTYAGRRVALLTLHGKERVIAPILEPALGCLIEHVSGFDTDQLGTFTREKPRSGTQIEAARCKARKGMELAGVSLGIASEGSFGRDPFTGMLPWNVELLIWIDDDLGIEIVGIAQGAASCGHLLSGDWQEVAAFAERENFPQHQLVLRPNGQDDPRIYKGIADWTHLRRCFDECLAQSGLRQVFVELDLRAFANSSRLKRIGEAAGDLLQRIQSRCPACEAPGFWIAERIPGLPCVACGLPTASYREEIWKCQRCDHHAVKDRTDMVFEDPVRCSYCNP